jgi:tetratricopeptide (TPR) repeat protein
MATTGATCIRCSESCSMTDPGTQAPEIATSFEERLEILTEELKLAIKWQRPCMVLVVYSSEYVRADVEAALENELIDLGQKGIHLSVKNRNPKDLVPFFKEFKDPLHSVFLIDGLRWGGGDEGCAYTTLSLQREYLVERQIRAVFWLTPNEIKKLTHAVPDFWAYRHRVIEFVESPKAEQVSKQALDSAWQGTGEYAAEFGDTDAKISLRESMLTELPKGEEAISIRGNLLLTLGVLNWRKGNFEKADEQLQEALQVATKIQDNWFEAECFNAVALIKSSTEQIDEAIKAYKQAIELAPDQIFVWNNLGNLCAKVGRNDEAMIAFRKALEGNPRDPIAWNGLANVHSRLGYVDDAIAAYRKSLQYTPTFAQPWCGLGDVYASMGRTDEALKCYHKAIELNKLYIAPWIQLGVLFSKQERYRDAVKAYQRALDLDERNSHVWNELGTSYLKSESYVEAAAAFSKAIELDRGNSWAYSNLAYAYMQQGKPKEGVSLLLRSIDLMESAADKAVSWNRLGTLYRSLNDYENAVAAYQMADQLTSGNPATNGQQPAEIKEEATGSPADTEQVSWAAAIPAATPNPPQNSTSKPAMETTPEQKEERPEAEAVRDAASKAPAWIFASTDDGKKTAAQTDGTGDPKPKKPNDEVTVTTTSKPDKTDAGNPIPQVQATPEPQKAAHAKDAITWTAKGNAHFNQGALEEAITAYTKAIQVDPGYGVPYSNLALTYVMHGQFAEAVLLYQKSIELLESDRDKALAWNGLGNAYRCTGDYANAVAAYQRAAEFDPETGGVRDRADDYKPRTTQRSSKACNNLGELLLKTGALDKAAEAFQQAIELEAKSGRAHSNLARVRAAQGRYSEAVPLYQKGIALLETDKEKADAWNGLGNAYRKLNDYDRAIKAYQEAVVLADEGVDLLTRTRFSLLSNVFINQ